MAGSISLSSAGGDLDHIALAETACVLASRNVSVGQDGLNVTTALFGDYAINLKLSFGDIRANDPGAQLAPGPHYSRWRRFLVGTVLFLLQHFAETQGPILEAA
ncbi:hypothetical protein [Magnetospirillum sp. 64-120]|uniref:hypothetical protein n=1 Tax=Magnetospirillum sp. 64-120 TaxID=1895778 RepID=UPI0025C36F05|nr:hypothetical protein [Magnetospirillum sp. 64-120]